jgi:hypothetical protein
MIKKGVSVGGGSTQGNKNRDKTDKSTFAWIAPVRMCHAGLGLTEPRVLYR